MERITKILIVFTIGMSAIAISRLVTQLSSLAFPLFFTIMGYILYKEMIRHKQIRIHPKLVAHAIPWLMIISLALMYEGHGMNYGTNDIGNYIAGASATLKNVVYFYDEVLSHKFLFAGMFGLFFAGALLQISRPFSFKMKKIDETMLGICGFLFGLGLSASVVEGQSPYLAIAASCIMLPFLLLHHRYHKKHSLKVLIRKYPLNYFIALTCITLLIVLAIDYAILGAFIEPSTLLCKWGYTGACVPY